MCDGDLLSDDPGKFQLPEKDVLLEPLLRVRQWRVVNAHICGPESWRMADYRGWQAQYDWRQILFLLREMEAIQ